MLPPEAFAEVVAFLRLFDLSALAVANARCSSLAVKASNTLRYEEFPGFHFFIANTAIEVYRCVDLPKDEDDSRSLLVTVLDFPSENDTIDFVAAAFPNCVVEELSISSFLNKRLTDAIARVAGSVVVTGDFRHFDSVNHDDSLKIVRSFRKVKAVQIVFTREVSADEAEEIANVYGGSGVQELLVPCTQETSGFFSESITRNLLFNTRFHQVYVPSIPLSIFDGCQ